MSDIDFGLGLDFVDPADGVPRQLRFERNWAPPGDPRVFDGTGQLVAVIADGTRPDNGHTYVSPGPASISTMFKGCSTDGKTGPASAAKSSTSPKPGAG